MKEEAVGEAKRRKEANETAWICVSAAGSVYVGAEAGRVESFSEE